VHDFGHASHAVSGARFCMLTTFYPPHHFGGDGIGLQHLCRALVRSGHHVTVVCDTDAYDVLRRGPMPQVDDGRDGVEVIRLRSRFPGLSTLLTQQTGRPVVNGARIRGILERGGFDVVNFHNVSLIGGPGLLAYGGDAVKIYSAHEHWLVCPTHVLWRHNREPCTGRQCLRCSVAYRRPPQLWRFTGHLGRRLHHVDAFIAMSEFSRDKHREFGFPRPMEVVPYLLPDERTAASKTDGDTSRRRPYFLFVGRLEAIKGLDDVIPLFADMKDADLLIAGDGTHEAELRRKAAGMDNVKFLGRLTPDELEPYYRNAVALVVPSVCFETFGIILIEAFRAGIPVVARRFGPFPEIVAQSGAGYSFETSDELRAALEHMLADPAERARLAERARKAFEESWSEEVIVPRYLDVVRRAALAKGQHELAATLQDTSRSVPVS
jgi:glycosyltransferase involved in cell wall biosynthesis